MSLNTITAQNRATLGKNLNNYLPVYSGDINPMINILNTNAFLQTIPAYDDDADAATAGLVAGDVYQTTGGGASPLDVAGIVMIKQ